MWSVSICIFFPNSWEAVWKTVCVFHFFLVHFPPCTTTAPLCCFIGQQRIGSRLNKQRQQLKISCRRGIQAWVCVCVCVYKMPWTPDPSISLQVLVCLSVLLSAGRYAFWGFVLSWLPRQLKRSLAWRGLDCVDFWLQQCVRVWDTLGCWLWPSLAHSGGPCLAFTVWELSLMAFGYCLNHWWRFAGYIAGWGLFGLGGEATRRSQKGRLNWKIKKTNSEGRPG